MRILPLLLLAALAAAPSPLLAQIPDRFENLQVLPENIPRDSLLQVMRGIAQSLGVRCAYCHVGPENARLEDLDFDSDDKVTKRQARFMMRMTRDLNTQALAQLPDRSDPPVRVMCITCHRGSPVPRTIDVVLAQVIDSAGVQAAVERYRELRREVERGRYDFGEGPVSDVARRLASAGRLDDAAVLLEMNAELHPRSAAVDVQLGDVYRARGEREKAIARYQAALQKEPNNPAARRRLGELTGAAPPRR